MPSNRSKNLSEIYISKYLIALTTIMLTVSLGFWISLVSKMILDDLECINSLWVPVSSPSL